MQITSLLIRTISFALFCLIVTNESRSDVAADTQLEHAVNAYQSGDFQRAHALLDPLLLSGSTDAILTSYFVSHWQLMLSGSAQKNSALEVYRKALRRLSTLAEQGNLEAMIEVSRQLVSERFIPLAARKKYLNQIVQGGNLEGYLLWVLSEDQFNPENYDQTIIKKYTEKQTTSQYDRAFWTGFISILNINQPVSSEVFDSAFSESDMFGDGRAYFLGCRLSVIGYIQASTRRIYEYCSLADQFGYTSALVGISNRIDTVQINKHRSNVNITRKILNLSENNLSVAHIATRWCLNTKKIDDIKTCIDFSINNHFRCTPNAPSLFSAEKFVKTQAYHMCRAFRFEWIQNRQKQNTKPRETQR